MVKYKEARLVVTVYGGEYYAGNIDAAIVHLSKPILDMILMYTITAKAMILESCGSIKFAYLTCLVKNMVDFIDTSDAVEAAGEETSERDIFLLPLKLRVPKKIIQEVGDVVIRFGAKDIQFTTIDAMEDECIYTAEIPYTILQRIRDTL